MDQKLQLYLNSILVENVSKLFLEKIHIDNNIVLPDLSQMNFPVIKFQ